MERRFVALRICGAIFKILAWTALILGVVLSFVALFVGLTNDLIVEWLDLPRGGLLLAVVAFLLLLILSALLFLGLYATGEFFSLALAVEENTRRSAYLAQQQYLAVQSTSAAVLDPYEEAGGPSGGTAGT